MSKCYLAGPMRGLPRFNYDAFDEAKKLGQHFGYTIVSPADIDREMGFDEYRDPNTVPLADSRKMIERDIAELMDCEYIALLTGWENSTGARVEVALARFLNLPILDANTFTPMDAYVVGITGVEHSLH